MSETVSDDELFTILLLSTPQVLRPDQNVFRAGLRAVFNAGRVSAIPSRETVAQMMYADHFDLLAVRQPNPTWREITETQRNYWRTLADSVLTLLGGVPSTGNTETPE